jgi:hypothetical protein
MLERVRETCGRLPQMLTADSGYLSDSNIAHCEARGVDAYIVLMPGELEGSGCAPLE